MESTLGSNVNLPRNMSASNSWIDQGPSLFRQYLRWIGFRLHKYDPKLPMKFHYKQPTMVTYKFLALHIYRQKYVYNLEIEHFVELYIA